MAEIVYLFGAGINRGVQDWDGLRPPLATDFFLQALKHHRIADDHYLAVVQSVFDYIKQYWKLSVDDLKHVPFDLEECYTLLQLQSAEAKRNGDHDSYVRLLEIAYRLTIMFAEYLAELEVFASGHGAFRALGLILYKEKPTIITFNYDTLLESVIESASGVTATVPESYRGRPPEHGDVPDGELPYSHYGWNRPLAYGVQFDEVQLQRAGITALVPGTRFYSHPENQMYDPPLLKLHGSLNWFVYTGVRRYQMLDSHEKTKAGSTLLYRGHWWFNEPADVGGEIVEPIIITPVLHKDIDDNSIMRELWTRARHELSECRRLVVGGYSFPPTDFHTRRLFLEAFVEKAPDEVIVINPDTSVIGLVKKLCHFDKPVLACRDLREFISTNTVGVTPDLTDFWPQRTRLEGRDERCQ